MRKSFSLCPGNSPIRIVFPFSEDHFIIPTMIFSDSGSFFNDRFDSSMWFLVGANLLPLVGVLVWDWLLMVTPYGWIVVLNLAILFGASAFIALSLLAARSSF